MNGGLRGVDAPGNAGLFARLCCPNGFEQRVLQVIVEMGGKLGIIDTAPSGTFFRVDRDRRRVAPRYQGGSNITVSLMIAAAPPSM